ncbi:MAG: FAD binding domain-containing protein [Rubrobacteraceae bacterium]
MKPPSFKYFAARSVEEAVSLLAEHGDDARVLAGGQSLIQDLNARRTKPRALIDVNPIQDLAFAQTGNGTLALGALTRTAAVERDAEITGRLPMLAEAAARVGHVAVRNRGTVGGNVAHADPASNLPPVMLTLDAEFTVQSDAGERTIAAGDFFQGPHQTAVGPTELLTGIRISSLPVNAGSAFVEISRRDRGWGLCGVAALVTLGDDGLVSDARLGLSGVGPTAVRARAAEDAIRGKEPTEQTWATAAGVAVRALEDPPSDIHASAGYRRHLADVLTRRALVAAAERAERSQR